MWHSADDCADEPAAPAPERALVNTVALDQFMAALDQLQSADASLAALIKLLDLANGASFSTDHIAALLSPMHERMASACDALGDLPISNFHPPVPAPAPTATVIVVRPRKTVTDNFGDMIVVLSTEGGSL